MRILFVVPYAPTLIRVRPYNLLRALAKRGHQVTLATLWESDQEREQLRQMQAEGIEVLAEPLGRARKAWNCIQALPTPKPLQAVFCDSPELRRTLEARVERDPGFDVAHVEHLRGAAYGLLLGRSGPAPVVWDSVDCISHLFEQAATRGRSLKDRLMTRLELGRTRRYEAWLAGQFDRVLVTSPADQSALSRLAERAGQPAAGPASPSVGPRVHPGAPEGIGGSPITVLPNGVDLNHFTPPTGTRAPETIVFSGKMSYHANIAAALHLAHEVMPLVWQRRPAARLVIAGSRPPHAVRGLGDAYGSRVEVTGYLEDMRAPLQSASLAAAPLLYGAGIQNKVLEAMACATPVVASPLAVSALQARPGEDCLVADGAPALAQSVLRLLDDARLRERVGRAGRTYVESNHDWNDIAAQLESIYVEVAEPHPCLT